MTRSSILVLLAACGGSSSHSSDAPNGTHDGPAAHDAPSTATSYTMSTIAGACSTLASPQTLPLLGLVHATDAYDLPAAFPFFGTQRTRFAVVEQGQVLLFDSQNTDITTLVDPVQIPSTDKPNGFVAPLWTFHLAYVDQRSAIRAETQSGDVIIEWTDFAVGTPFPDPISHVTMQAKLLHDGAIELHYCQLEPGQNTQNEEHGAKGSIGIESPDGTKGFSAGFQMAAAQTATAFRFTPM